ncbi:MAG: polysaccharide pyruvyl transferase family protein [Candidatus Pacebacteria bacterium]|nr:polysaccharide pyruvyl transferase family protein [Candidatus Paceibacterota bacterium]
MIKAYWWPAKNFGDMLTPVILKHFFPNEQIKISERGERGKLLAVGSIVHLALSGDVVWGSGSNRPWRKYNGRGVRYLAVRGPWTRNQIKNAVVPKIYGDPAILLPLIFNPQVEKKYKIGLVPHYVDKPLVKASPGEKIIDIQGEWTEVIYEILSCEKIISSSLHGIIAAEAYGIPTQWAVWGKKIVGGDFKYQDYFLGSGRERQKTMSDIPPIPDLENRQNKIINALKQWKS